MSSNDSGTSLSRRRFLKLAAGGAGALGLSSLLAACGSAAAPAGDAGTTGGAGAAATTAPAQGDQAVTEITFWWWDDGGKIWADAYAKVNPKIKVNFVNTPFA